MSYLEDLEAESIHIIREATAQANNPVMLYSMGKDSTVMLHLACKAFFSAPIPSELVGFTDEGSITPDRREPLFSSYSDPRTCRHQY